MFLIKSILQTPLLRNAFRLSLPTSRKGLMMANTSFGEAGVFLAWTEEFNMHFLECAIELYEEIFFLGSQQNRELGRAERITLDVELICINSSKDHTADV